MIHWLRITPPIAHVRRVTPENCSKQCANHPLQGVDLSVGTLALSRRGRASRRKDEPDTPTFFMGDTARAMENVPHYRFEALLITTASSERTRFRDIHLSPRERERERD